MRLCIQLAKEQILSGIWGRPYRGSSLCHWYLPACINISLGAKWSYWSIMCLQKVNFRASADFTLIQNIRQIHHGLIPLILRHSVLRIWIVGLILPHIPISNINPSHVVLLECSNHDLGQGLAITNQAGARPREVVRMRGWSQECDREDQANSSE